MNGTKRFRQARDFLLHNSTDYHGARRGFEWPRMEYFNWALDWFDVISRDNSNIALWMVGDDGSESKIRFSDLSRRSNQVANFLRRKGVRRGDRILLMLPNRLELWESMLASIKLGAVVVPSTVLLSEADLRDRIERGRIDHLITETDQTEKFEASPASSTRFAVGGAVEGWTCYSESEGEEDAFVADSPTRADDPLLLYFTSGTTAKPKLVLHTHQSYPVGHLSTMYWIGLRPGDVHLNISSPGWAKHAWSSFFAPWNAEATILVYGYERFDAASLMDTVVGCGVTSLCAPPTVWRLLIQLPLQDYPVKLRQVVSAGEPLNASVIEAVESAWGIAPRDGFGQTETSALIGNTPGQPLKPGFMGRPLPGYDIALRDLEGRSCREGEVWISTDPRPVGLMAGYLDRPLQGTDGYSTGDIAQTDEDGYFRFVGRNDDIFKSADYRISPFELESMLIRHPAVAEAAVVPSPHATRLSVPKAFVTLRKEFRPGAEVALDIFRFTRQEVSPFKRVRRLEFGPLPKTISGKIRRVELRDSEGTQRDDSKKGTVEFWEEDFAGLL